MYPPKQDFEPMLQRGDNVGETRKREREAKKHGVVLVINLKVTPCHSEGIPLVSETYKVDDGVVAEYLIHVIIFLGRKWSGKRLKEVLLSRGGTV